VGEDSSSKRWKVQPEEALQLQEEIEDYLSSKSPWEGEWEPPRPAFEQRLIDALGDRETAEEFFGKMLAFCRVGTNEWHWAAKAEPEILWLAVQSRVWLERQEKKPIKQGAIRKLVKMLWAARLLQYRPKEWWEGIRTVDSSETGRTRRPEPWSEFDYITSVQTAMGRDAKFAADLEKRAHLFPNHTFKRVRPDPRLCDVKP
jgi:hypothetical protein